MSLDSRVVGQAHGPYFSFINFLGFKMWWWFKYFSSIILISCPMRLWQKHCDCKWDMSTCTILCCFRHHKGFSLDTQQLPTFQSIVYHSTVKDFLKKVTPYSPIMSIKYNSKNMPYKFWSQPFENLSSWHFVQ